MKRLAACLTALLLARGASAQNLHCHDASGRPPRLLLVQNLWGLVALPTKDMEWPEGEKLAHIKEAGFDAFDVWVGGASEKDVEQWRASGEKRGLGVGVETGPNRVEDLVPSLAAAKRLGSVYLDVHVGNSFVPEAQATEILRGLSEEAKRADIAMVVQTHRGRVTQDLIRTVGYARAIPDLRFDLDLSHYFVGGEFGGAPPPEAQPFFDVLLDRAVMLDGRVSNGEQVQIDMGPTADNAETRVFAAMWKRVMVHWLKEAKPGDVFPFRVELGPPGYAILDPAGREISDRWGQQKIMAGLVVRLWNEAVAETGRGTPHATAPPQKPGGGL
jgi:hypothetical protein